MFVLCSLFCHYDRVKDFTKYTWPFWEIKQVMLGSRTNQWQQTSPELQDNPAWPTVSSAVASWWTAGFSITRNWTAVKLLQCLHCRSSFRETKQYGMVEGVFCHCLFLESHLKTSCKASTENIAPVQKMVFLFSSTSAAGCLPVHFPLNK